MASFWGGMLQAVKEGDLNAVVSQTQDGIGKLRDNIDKNIKQAQADVEAEKASIRAEKTVEGKVTSLPWEIDDESKSILQDDLMEKVLGLSLDDSTFTEPPDSNTGFDFDLAKHVDVVMKLLELDPNLATRHARLSPKINEETFWRHYFHRCALLRAEVGVGAALPPKSRGGITGSDAAGASEDAEAVALEKEVTDALGDEDLDFNLDDMAEGLDDLDDDALDDELEAQIAAELEREGGEGGEGGGDEEDDLEEPDLTDLDDLGDDEDPVVVDHEEGR